MWNSCHLLHIHPDFLGFLWTIHYNRHFYQGEHEAPVASLFFKLFCTWTPPSNSLTKVGETYQLPVTLSAQLAEHCTGIVEVMHSNPAQAQNCFSGFLFPSANTCTQCKRRTVAMVFHLFIPQVVIDVFLIFSEKIQRTLLGEKTCSYLVRLLFLFHWNL